MKHMKKLVSVLLTLVMTLVLVVPALAATVTVPSDGILKDHTFTAYQVFSGREEDGVLSDVQWGSGIDSTAFLAALKADATYGSLFTNCTDAAAVAKVLSDNNTNTALANQVAKLAYDNKTGTGTVLTSGENTLADGYYLVVDTTADVGQGGAYNAALLQVVGDNIEIKVKTDAPSIDKIIVDADANNGKGTAQDVGSKVQFQLNSTVPDMEYYDTYTYIVHDTMSAGLTFNNDVVVTIGGVAYTDFTVAKDGQSFTITFNDFINQKANKGKAIVITYSATINENALTTNVETNTVYLEYSNQPNDSTSKGKTPNKTVYVYDFDIVIDKYTGDETTGARLSDAKFVLLNVEKTKYYYYNETTKKVEWNALADGETMEDVLKAGYNGTTKITEVTTDATGAAKFQGLDSGTYYLHETAAPAGYNMLAGDVEVIISATYNTDGTIANSTATSTGNGQYQQTQKVENNAGTTLPETGGMGTTLFYVLGSILVLGAGILLVTKKRMSSEK